MFNFQRASEVIHPIQLAVGGILFVLFHRRILGKEQQPNFLHLLYHPMIKTKLLISFRGNKSIRWTHIFSQSNHHTISSWLYISVTYPLYQYPHGNCHILGVNLESSPDNQPSANHNLSTIWLYHHILKVTVNLDNCWFIHIMISFN